MGIIAIDSFLQSEMKSEIMTNSKRLAARPKHEIVRDTLTQNLRAGEFEVGRRLPGDKELAARFGVSYMTARKAVNELVEASLLERRIGDGTYVREGSQQRLSTTTLNLICTAYEGSTTKTFLQMAGVAAQDLGWRSHVIRTHSDHEIGALRAITGGELCLILADEELFRGPLNKAIRGAGGRTVVLGARMGGDVAAVLADDARAVEIAFEHLRERGHRNIALLCNHIENTNEQIQIAVWQAQLAADGNASQRENWRIETKTPRFQCASRYAYDAMMSWLRSDASQNVSAVISIGDELSVGASCACREFGRAIPGDLSLVNLNDAPAMEFSNPRITCVDIDLESHVARAIEVLRAGLRGAATSPDAQLVEPRLIARESVRPI